MVQRSVLLLCQLLCSASTRGAIQLSVFLKDNFLTEQNPWIPATQVDRQNDGHGHSPPSSMPAPHNESHGESASGVHTAWANGHPGR